MGAQLLLLLMVVGLTIPYYLHLNLDCGENGSQEQGLHHLSNTKHTPLPLVQLGLMPNFLLTCAASLIFLFIP